MYNIIGGGPVGSYTAYLLAKAGKQVNLFEEHKTIGSPVQCTGIVTADIKNIPGLDLPKECILNYIYTAKVFAPNGKHIKFNLKNPNIILDRQIFDQYIADLAHDSGANIQKGKRIDSRQLQGNIIGADGPLSQIYPIINKKNKKRKFWTGIQARIKLKNDNSVEFYPYIGTYAWIVPENTSTVRIGVVAKKNTAEIFNNFLKSRAPSAKIINKQAGIIPEYDPSTIIHKKNFFVVGDSAGHVKATTGGGIIPGLKAAKVLAKSLLKNKDYQKNCKKAIGKDLWLHLKIRNLLNNFSKKDWNYLIKLMSGKRTKSIIEQHDREHPSRFILKILASEPRLVYFIKNIL